MESTSEKPATAGKPAKPKRWRADSYSSGFLGPIGRPPKYPRKYERLSSIGRAAAGRAAHAAALSRHAAESAQNARDFNKTIRPGDQENFYLAGMNLIAKKFWELAADPKSAPESVRTYADVLLRHFEQKLKREKIAIMGRHLRLLENKMEALQALARGPALPSAEFALKLREICSLNGHDQTEAQKPKLIEDRTAS